MARRAFSACLIAIGILMTLACSPACAQPEPPPVIPPPPLIVPPTFSDKPSIPPNITFPTLPSPMSQPPVFPSRPRVFPIQLDAKTPVKDLLPALPQAALKLPAYLNEDLALVPEVMFGDPIAKSDGTEKGLEHMAFAVAKINHLNKQKPDGFMEALIAHRSDLRGLTFHMGDECRSHADHAALFAIIAEIVQANLRQVKNATTASDQEQAEVFWTKMHQQLVAGDSKDVKRLTRASQENIDRAMVAALMQILMPESEQQRAGLAKFLGAIHHVDAIQALAKLALFSPEDSVRSAAVAGLKLRREKDYTDILMQGFRYPLPAVSKRAAEALVKLDRKDLLANLVEVLEQPDPRAPAPHKIDGVKVPAVRELVRVNHHRNCLLCHAPGNTGNLPTGILNVAAPLPSEPLTSPNEGAYQRTPQIPDLLVRVDMTYLRQDFSLMLRVGEASPWPALQRFDFLVRVRALTPREAKECQDVLQKQRATGQLPPNHRAALFALRELTGRDTEPTAPAWRRLLELP